MRHAEDQKHELQSAAPVMASLFKLRAAVVAFSVHTEGLELFQGGPEGGGGTGFC